jgi:hypothetical protein
MSWRGCRATLQDTTIVNVLTLTTDSVLDLGQAALPTTHLLAPTLAQAGAVHVVEVYTSEERVCYIRCSTEAEAWCTAREIKLHRPKEVDSCVNDVKNINLEFCSASDLNPSPTLVSSVVFSTLDPYLKILALDFSSLHSSLTPPTVGHVVDVCNPSDLKSRISDYLTTVEPSLPGRGSFTPRGCSDSAVSIKGKIKAYLTEYKRGQALVNELTG